MAKTIVWANHKGGVGKTTGAANTSAAHAETGARVLAVDLDPQGHLGELFAVEQHPGRPRLEHVMLRQVPVRDAIVAVGGRLDVLPCSEELAEAQPKRRRNAGAAKDRNTPPTHADKRADRATAPEALPAHAPYAGEPKVQVNPRIYRGIWRHYEQLVDELPRERRRGALTALVNAVLAQHAPRDVDAARRAIVWLRQAEVRDEPADTGEQR